MIDIVRKDNALLGALLADSRPVSLSDRNVTIAFPAAKAFAKTKAEQDDYRRATADALRSLTGATLALHYELRDVSDPEEIAAQDTGLTQEELVRRLVEEFDAQEVLEDPDDAG